MSRQNSDSDPLFESTGFDAPQNEPVAVPQTNAAPARPVQRPRPFDIYTVMLICSVVFLVAATIVLFMDAGKY